MNISSRHNEQIKFVKKLYRRRYRDQFGLYLAEGLRLVEDINQTKAIEAIYYSPRLLNNKRGSDLLSQVRNAQIPTYACTESVFSEISSTDTDQGILAIVKKPESSDITSNLIAKTVLIVDKIQDPGNLGTIIRTALASGVDNVWLVHGTVDLFNPKVVRASMGAIQRISYLNLSIEQSITYCAQHGLRLIATDLKDADPYFKCDFSSSHALVIGNEGNGVSELFLDRSDQKVFIPIMNEVESLNVATATAILLFEGLRQRELN